MRRNLTQNELAQRERLKATVANRSRPTIEDYKDLGAPMLDEYEDESKPPKQDVFL